MVKFGRGYSKEVKNGMGVKNNTYGICYDSL